MELILVLVVIGLVWFGSVAFGLIWLREYLCLIIFGFVWFCQILVAHFFSRFSQTHTRNLYLVKLGLVWFGLIMFAVVC